jgi:hypothetical protein
LEALPYQQNISTERALELASGILQVLNIPGEPKCISSSARDALMLDTFSRYKWWIKRHDRVRWAMHRLGIRIYEKDALGKPIFSEALSSAFESAKYIGDSREWRLHFRSLSKANGEEHLYMQLFFRVAQQILSRYIRWRSVFGPKPTPYEYLLQLTKGGIFPIGFFDNTYYIFNLNGTNTVAHHPVPQIPTPGNSRDIFLCYEFRNSKVYPFILNILTSLDLGIAGGPVNELDEPIEHQLGRKIAGSLCLVAFVEEVDEDFGLPIWLYQEINLALFLKKPVLVITSAILDNFWALQDIKIVRVSDLFGHNSHTSIVEFLKEINPQK